MNAHDLGDVEEYFMGHKVTGDVSKLYNRKDRQGQKMMVKKAKEVFAILDKTLFKIKTKNSKISPAKKKRAGRRTAGPARKAS
jgi:hypothetical protein